MKKISLEAYHFEPSGAQKNYWRELILDYFKQAPEGQKTSFKESNNDPDKMMRKTYLGYLAEIKVLNRLKEKNPDQNWHFIDDDHGYFVLGPTNNLPDLTNDYITVEVKQWYRPCKFWFTTKYNYSVEKAWDKKFHGADYVITYWLEDNTYKIISREDFIKKAVKYYDGKYVYQGD